MFEKRHIFWFGVDPHFSVHFEFRGLTRVAGDIQVLAFTFSFARRSGADGKQLLPTKLAYRGKPGISPEAFLYVGITSALYPRNFVCGSVTHGRRLL